MSTQPKPFITPEEYLAIERAAEFRSEYFNGEMFCMPGGTLNHVTIIVNTSAILNVQLRGRICRVVSTDLRLQTHRSGPYFYPDIAVFCGKPPLADQQRDMITDAAVIIEVLSSSTERYDRSFKFEHYQRLPSLKDYILIAQDRVNVEHRTLGADGNWTARVTTDLEAVIQISSIDCSFQVADAYDRVEFQSPE
jgi:Uma2 family endonuclease